MSAGLPANRPERCGPPPASRIRGCDYLAVLGIVLGLLGGIVALTQHWLLAAAAALLTALVSFVWFRDHSYRWARHVYE